MAVFFIIITNFYFISYFVNIYLWECILRDGLMGSSLWASLEDIDGETEFEKLLINHKSQEVQYYFEGQVMNLKPSEKAG